MKRLISILLVVLLTVSLLPQVSIISLAVETEGVYCNGTDYFVAEDGTEFFINSDDEDKLYQITPSGEVSLAVDEHTILLVNNGDTAYLVVFRNEECKLVRFDASSGNSSDIYTFPDAVCNIALRSNELLYTLDGAAYALNLATMGLSVLKESGINTIYFDENDDLAYVSSSHNDNSSPDVSNELTNSRGSNRSVTNYSPRLTAPATDNPYYTTLNVFYNSGYGMAPNIGNCTCYAFGRSYENLGTEPMLCHNNAGDWYAYNKNNGYYQYGPSPVLGSVAVWKSGGAGHVAVVEVISGDSVITSESGWQSFYFKTVTRSASNSNFSASSYYSFQGFIYVLGTAVSNGPPAGIPQNVYAAQKAANTVGVSWDEAANATSYDVYLVQSPYGWDDIKYSTSVSSAYHYAEIDGVAPGDYSVFVIARPNENSAQSAWVPITVESVGIPQNVAAGQKAADVVGVSWDSVQYATSYDVYLVQEPYGWDDIKYSVKVSADYQYAELDGIAPGEYRAFVVARPNANDNQSSWVAVTVEEVGIPQNIVVARRAMDSIGVSWDAVPFATSYDVYMIQSPYAWADIKYSVKVSADYQYAVLDGIAPGEYRVFLIARPNDDYTHQSMWKAVNIKSEYTVTFDPSGGTCSKESKIVVYGQTYGELPTPQKELLTFDGWYTAETGGRKITSSSVVDLLNDQTLYAHWSNPCSEGHSYTYAVTMAPTISAAGDLAGTCSKCGSTTTVTLPKLDTTNYNYAVVTAATCTANGTGRYTWKTTTYGTFTFDVSIPKTNHSYTYAVTAAPTTSAAGVLTGTCSKCNGTTTVALPKLDTTNYNYAVVTAATCTANGTGRYTWKTTTYGTFTFDVSIPKTGHSYTYAVTTVPTTSAAGVLTGTCSKCGGTTTVTLPKLDITNYTYTVVTEATCTANGTGRYTWKTTTYGTFTFDVTIPKTGHSYTYAVTTAPTTSTTGELTGTCSKCGGTTTVTLPKLNTTDYSYSVVTAATCTATGTGRYTWKTTTYGTFYFDVTIPKTGHSYTYAVTTEPTTSATGVLTGTCSKCGNKTTVTLPKLDTTNYIYTVVTAATCTANGTGRYTWKTTTYGTFSFDVTIPKTGHSYTYAVTTAPTTSSAGVLTGTCSKCGGTTTVTLPKLDTTNYNYAVVTAAACTANGTGRYTWKTTTYGTFTFDVTIPKTGHSNTYAVTTTPTTSAAGVLTGTCSKCGSITTVALPKLDTTNYNYTVVTAATCTANGTGRYTWKTTTYGTFTFDVSIPKTNHSYTYAVTKAPTTSATGTLTGTCANCGGTTTVTLPKLNTTDYTYSVVTAATCTATGTGRYTWKTTTYGTFSFDVTIAKTAHSYVDTVTAPTCTEQGYTTHTCSVCGNTYNDTYIAALGHKPGTAVEENRVSPTCTENGGFDTVTYCTICGAELSRVHTNLSALGHIWDDGVIDPSPSCTADGVKTYTCQRCGETKTEAIAATGHTAGESAKENEVAATCTTVGGYDMVIRCTVCNAILYTEHFEIAALGHDYQAVVTAPTCTEGGYTTYTCSRCGDSYVADETAALGHTSGEPVKENDLAPTCEVAGGYDMVVYCTVCGAEISREHTDVAAIGHEWNEPEYVWADDYSTVTATRICKNNASHKETETVNTTSEVTKPATYEAEGEIFYTAAFENEVFATQTKTVTIPKLEKPDDPTPSLPCDGGESCPGNIFTDMPAKGNWAHDAIDWAIVNKITAGTSATTFSPNAGCTRAQVVTFLWRAAGEPEPETTNNPFADVKEGTWYYKAVLWAAETGVTAGTSATTFSPDATCTRAQIVTFLWRFEGEPASTTTNNPFTDVKAGAYYEKAVLWASETGVTAGTSATTFSPDATCTRAQVVTFLYRDICLE